MNEKLFGKKPKHYRLKKHISQTQFIAYRFFLIIMTGSLLLMLPIVSRDGQSESFLNYLFTAISVSYTTGLVMTDTQAQWSLFGQMVLLVLIQLRGLGLISIGIFLSIVLRKKVRLKGWGLMQEGANTLQIGGMVKLTKKITIGTAVFEGAGAVILACRSIPEYGPVYGTWYGIFHSVSAFCNAGFDLMGHTSQHSSLYNHEGDWVVIETISFLIITGDIGFIVWDDLPGKKLDFHHYMLHTKIVLITTAVLLITSTILFYLMERNNILVGMDGSEFFLACFFSVVTPRTAGFNNVNTAALTDGSKFLLAILMLIGGSPGSTVDGIKTSTLAVLLLYAHSNIRQIYGVEVFGRRLEDEPIRQPACILTTNLGLVLAAIIAIMVSQNLPMSDVFFETCSAIGTLGMSTGVTRSLNSFFRIVIILLMYCRRIGSLSFVLAFTRSSRKPHVQLPAKRITTGQREVLEIKSILVIGTGRFGQYPCENLARHGNQVTAVNISEEKLEPVLPYVVSAKIGDRTNEAALKSLEIGNFDICFIYIGNNFQNSLEVTNLIKEIGTKYVVSKTNRNIRARLPPKSGVNEVVYPDRDVAEKVAVRYNANNALDYTELADGIFIYEIKPLSQQVGKSIKDSDIRRLYSISVIAVKNPDGHMRFMSGADHVIVGGNHLMVIGKQEDAEKIVKYLTKNV